MSSATVSRAVLFDVDGTLIDAAANQRRVWALWAHEFGVNPNTTYEVALGTRPTETFAIVAAHHDPARCLDRLHQLKDQDATTGTHTASDGAATLLGRLTTPTCRTPPGQSTAIRRAPAKALQIRLGFDVILYQ